MISALALLALVGIGCGDDDGGGSGGTSGASGSGGTAGTAGTSGTGGDPGFCTGDATDHPNCANEECLGVGPTAGPRTQKGACCFRVSNADRAQAAWDAGETATLEFRQNALKTSSQPMSVGNPLIQASLGMTYENDWSNTLVRVEGIPATGSGPVTVTIGAGRSNCDGTYSFFGDGAAPDHEGRTDANRWTAAVMPGTWDWSTPEKLSIAQADRPAGVRWAPVAKDHGLFGYEQPSQDLNYEFAFEGGSNTDVTPQALNCVGGALEATVWRSELVQTTFFQVDELKTARVDSLTLTQNFCSFMALGFMPENATPCDDVMQSEWAELPSGMCDDEHCYVGDADHDLANCGGTTGNDCCDPTGVSTEMAACNAFVIEATAVLGGAEITDAPYTNSAEPFTNCTL